MHFVCSTCACSLILNRSTGASTTEMGMDAKDPAA